MRMRRGYGAHTERPAHTLPVPWVIRAIGGVACALVLAVAPLRAQGTESAPAARAGILLTLPTSARALGLAEAAGATEASEWALFAAPAQLARAKAFAAGIASEAYLASTHLSAVAVAVPVWRGTLGLGATLLDYGSVREIASSTPGLDGVETGRTVSAQDDAIVIGYGLVVPGMPWLQGIRAGAAMEFVRTRVADLSASGVAASAGLAWTSGGGWDVSAGVQHVGTDISIGATRGALPRTWRAGLAAPAMHMGRVHVRPMAEVRTTRLGGNAAAVAGEVSWPGTRGAEFAVRGGYTVRGGGADDHWPVSLGAGVGLGRFSIDYAMQRFTRIDQVTHRIGIRFARPSPGPAAREAARATSGSTVSPTAAR